VYCRCACGLLVLRDSDLWCQWHKWVLNTRHAVSMRTVLRFTAYIKLTVWKYRCVWFMRNQIAEGESTVHIFSNSLLSASTGWNGTRSHWSNLNSTSMQNYMVICGIQVSKCFWRTFKNNRTVFVLLVKKYSIYFYFLNKS